MSFMPLAKPPGERIVPGVGPKSARIAIVGEAPGAYEDHALKPFVGPAGSVLEQCLHTAGLIRSEVYLTNVVKVKPAGNNIEPYFSTTKGRFTPLGMQSVHDLHAELNDCEANILVACGGTALCALTGEHKILKYRGYILESQGLSRQRKVLACIHPAAALRGMYTYRYLIATDLKKAKEFSESPELERPERKLVYNFNSCANVLEWLAYYEQAKTVAFDIEVLNFEIACISFASEGNIAISVPLVRCWSPQEEIEIYRGIQRVLGNPNSVKVAQNGIFDTQFLLARCGIVVRGEIHDTMIGHHIAYPDLPKGLGFLGSIYCGSQRYWKDAVSFKSIKEED